LRAAEAGRRLAVAEVVADTGVRFLESHLEAARQRKPRSLSRLVQTTPSRLALEGQDQPLVRILTRQPTEVILFCLPSLQQAAVGVVIHRMWEKMVVQEVGVAGQTDQIPQEAQEQQIKVTLEEPRFQFLTGHQAVEVRVGSGAQELDRKETVKVEMEEREFLPALLVHLYAVRVVEAAVATIVTLGREEPQLVGVETETRAALLLAHLARSIRAGVEAGLDQPSA